MMKPASLRQLGSCCLPHALQNPAGSSSVRGAGRCYPSSRSLGRRHDCTVHTTGQKNQSVYCQLQKTFSQAALTLQPHIEEGLGSFKTATL